MSDLKPCRFCGSSNVGDHVGLDGEFDGMVTCYECHSLAKRELWNRPTPTAPRPEACPRCKGTGKLTVSVEMREGKFNEKPCRICGGSGKAGLDSGLEVK